MITLLPPAWQAAQLALKILAPLATSAAAAGEVKAIEQSVNTRVKIEISFFKTVLLSKLKIKKPKLSTNYCNQSVWAVSSKSTYSVLKL
jgi:hypothetical protein